MNGLEAEAVALDIRGKMLGKDQRAGKIIGPAMIPADKLGGRATLVIDDARAAMAADIVEGAHHSVGTPHDHDGIAAEADHVIVAGLRHIRLDPDMDPVAGPDGLEIGCEDLVAEIERRFQAVAGRPAPDQRGHGHRRFPRW